MIDHVANHLWQSTVFAGAVALFTMTCRRQQARVRYGLWLAASLKFLVPFALLISIGRQLEWAPLAREFAVPSVSSAVIEVTEPFVGEVTPSPAAVVSPTRGSAMWWPRALVGLWLGGLAVIVVLRVRLWRRIRSALALSAPCRLGDLDIPSGVDVRSTPGLPEPGVVGWRRPTVLVPRDIAEYVTPRQLEAVLAHELCHIRRRDNLTAALQMVVEALFWFHPLVWWIGARLVDERERACDEHVLSVFGEPRTYAEGIVNVCRQYVEAPLMCVSGVSGTNLKKRIEAILTNRRALRLNLAKAAVLAGAGIAAVIVPVAVGVLTGPALRAQSTVIGSPREPRPVFDVASVKPIDRALMQRDHQGRQLTRTTFVDRTDLLQFIVRAYLGANASSCVVKAGLGEDCPFIVGTLPAWLKTDRFEIEAKLPANSLSTQPTAATSSARRNGDTPRQVSLMLQGLLEDRFHLKVHRETRELPVWALTIGKNGPKLTPAAALEVRKWPDGTSREIHGLSMILRMPGSDRRRMTFKASSMQETADELAMYFDRPVVDRTNLQGDYDFVIEWEADADAPAPAAVENTSGLGGGYFNPYRGLTASELSTALGDVGLKLESTKATVEVLVIDHAEKPSPD